jgi:hypothetical protein
VCVCLVGRGGAWGLGAGLFDRDHRLALLRGLRGTFIFIFTVTFTFSLGREAVAIIDYLPTKVHCAPLHREVLQLHLQVAVLVLNPKASTLATWEVTHVGVPLCNLCRMCMFCGGERACV